jgi:hypothetical protein
LRGAVTPPSPLRLGSSTARYSQPSAAVAEAIWAAADTLAGSGFRVARIASPVPLADIASDHKNR